MDTKQHTQLELDIEMLQPNPLQARGLINPDSLSELISSIKEHGILEPIVAAQTPAGYQIIAGERRWRAAKAAGLQRVPVVVKETTTRGMLELAIVENVQREDLNPIERAQAFQRLVEEFALTVTEIAARIGKSESYVSNAIRLLGLPDAIKDGLMSGAISEGHARAIAGLGDMKLMVDAYKIILAENASVRAAEELARKLKSQHNKPLVKRVERIHSDELTAMEKELSATIGGKVTVSQSMVQARMIIIINGHLEDTTKKLRDISTKIKAESST